MSSSSSISVAAPSSTYVAPTAPAAATAAVQQMEAPAKRGRKAKN